MIPIRTWEWLGIVVLGPIATLVILEQLALPDGWRGGLEYLAAVLAIGALAAWVWLNRRTLREYESRRQMAQALLRTPGLSRLTPGHRRASSARSGR